MKRKQDYRLEYWPKRARNFFDNRIIVRALSFAGALALILREENALRGRGSGHARAEVWAISTRNTPFSLSLLDFVQDY